MRPSLITKALSQVGPSRIATWLHGPPGVGKSSVIRQAAESHGIEFLDFRPLNHDPSDVKFPIVDVANKSIEWVQSIFPTDPNWTGIIAIEELAQAPQLMQAALLELVLDRSLGRYKLPEGAWVVATGNRREDAAGVARTITPLNNRFVHLDMDVSHEDWTTWSVDHISSVTRSFMAWRPSLLHQFDAKSPEPAFPSPRSWEFVDQLYPLVSDETIHPVLAGAVGKGPAAEFVGFLKIYRDLPDLDELLANPNTAEIPPRSNSAVMFALTGALPDKINISDNGHCAPIVEAVQTYCRRLPQEFSALSLLNTISRIKGTKHQASVMDWVRDHKDILLGN